MNDKQRQTLEVERAMGEQHQRAWENTIEPFFIDKQKQLFDAFVDCSTTDKETLMGIKLQQNALDSLRGHFNTFIETGKMASQQLTEGEENGSN